jgi:hypothetical protein
VELKAKVVGLIERAFDEERALFDRLSEEERSVIGEPDQWSPRDVIVHSAKWKVRLAANLAAADAGETPVRHEDYETINAREFEEHRDRSWPDVLEMAADASRQLAEQVEARTEEELGGTDTLPWQEDRPLWRLVVGNGFVHPVTMHLGPVYIARGEKALATQLMEEAAALLRELDDGTNWQGLVRYNLACHYALVGEAGRALQGLGEALELNPGLTEWSKEDPDFACIRGDPGYLALYGD